jgi:hypothetical protein
VQTRNHGATLRQKSQGLKRFFVILAKMAQQLLIHFGHAEHRAPRNWNLEGFMRRIKLALYTALATCLWMLPAFFASAAGGGGSPIVLVSDTRKLTGVMHWWGSLYNESHIQFTLLTIILIPVTGCLFGLIADVVMNWIGIDLKTRKVSEH